MTPRIVRIDGVNTPPKVPSPGGRPEAPSEGRSLDRSLDRSEDRSDGAEADEVGEVTAGEDDRDAARRQGVTSRRARIPEEVIGEHIPMQAACRSTAWPSPPGAESRDVRG